MSTTNPYQSQSVKSLFALLAEKRTSTLRDPETTVKIGEALVEKGGVKGSKDEVWEVLEQIAKAAIECGKLELAEVCAERLTTRFPDSPRVNVLLGMVMEGRGLLLEAKDFYTKLLLENENDDIRKRLIMLHLTSPPTASSSTTVATTSSTGAKDEGLSRTKGIELLVEYLDTYYNDVDGWSQLAHIYAHDGLYAQSLTALSHLILLLPHSPYHLLRHAETAYTVGEFALAYKEFLRVVEMCEGNMATGGEDLGVGRRAAIGVKLTLARLSTLALTQSSTAIAEPVLRPREMNAVDLVVTKLILDAYSSKEAVGAGIVRRWAGGSQESR